MGRLAVALALTASLMVGAVIAANYVIDVKLASVSRVGLHTAATSSGPLNFLLVGSDSRAFTKGNSDAQQHFGTDQSNAGQRSDTLMVLHVDPDRHQTVVVSFPRDMWVNIPGRGRSKINAAYNDGPQKVIDMLQADYNIKINHFVRVDFVSFQGVVNAIGTVPVYLPYRARDDLTGLFVPSPGCQRLNGADALAYVRSRDMQFYSSSKKRWLPADAIPDINRITRQQQFIKQLAGVAVQRGLRNPITGNQILNRVLEHLTVDKGLSKDDVLTLVDAFRSISPQDTGHVQFTTMPFADGPNQDGQQVLYLREPDADSILSRLGGSVVPANVAIISAGSSRPSGLGSTGSTSSTSTPTSPSSTSSSSTPTSPTTLTPPTTALSGSPTPSIENQQQFGAPAPKAAPCT